MFKNILVPTDFSQSATRALQIARTEFPQAHLKLLHVFDSRPLHTPAMDGMGSLGLLEDTADTLREQARETLQALHQEGEEVELVSGPPIERILEEVRNFQPDLVVMGTHGRQGLSHLFFGSVAEGVLRAAHVPVLVVREQ